MSNVQTALVSDISSLHATHPGQWEPRSADLDASPAQESCRLISLAEPGDGGQDLGCQRKFGFVVFVVVAVVDDLLSVLVVTVAAAVAVAAAAAPVAFWLLMVWWCWRQRC